MSRDVTVTHIQTAIADLRAWANGSGYLPPSKPDLLRALADLLEALLVHREEFGRDEGEKT